MVNMHKKISYHKQIARQQLLCRSFCHSRGRDQPCKFFTLINFELHAKFDSCVIPFGRMSKRVREYYGDERWEHPLGWAE